MKGAQKSIDDRFWAKVDKIPGGCWIWTASLVPGTNYGSFYVTYRKRQNAHRWAYERLVGEVPDGLHLDHLCRVRHCVNPAHLEPVTPRENAFRSPIATAAVNARKTHCPQGHPYDDVNTARYGGRRYCIACRNIRNAARLAAERLAAA